MRVHTASMSRHRPHALFLAALHLALLVGITDPLAATSPPTPSPVLEAPTAALPLDPPVAAEPAPVLLAASFSLPYVHQPIVAGDVAHLVRDIVYESELGTIAPPDVHHAHSGTTLHTRAGELTAVPPDTYRDHALIGAPYRPRHHREVLDFHGRTYAGSGERRPGR